MQSNIESNTIRGVLAGLAAGIVVGLLLQLGTSTTPAGSRVIMMELFFGISGTRSAVLSWSYHLFISIVIGGVFGAIAGSRTRTFPEGFKNGPFFGLVWWLLGGLFLMPIYLGLSIFSPQTIAPIPPVAIQSLIGHLIYGLVLGGTFVALGRRSEKAEVRQIRERTESDRTRFKAG